MPSQAVVDCCASISNKKWKIAFAEGITAGRMCAEFAATPCSGIIRGGLSFPDQYVKDNILKIPFFVTDKFDGETPEATASLALYAAAFFSADLAIAITGTPLDDPGEKPGATVYINVIFPSHTVAYMGTFYGDYNEISLQAIEKACTMINNKLVNEVQPEEQ